MIRRGGRGGLSSEHAAQLSGMSLLCARCQYRLVRIRGWGTAHPGTSAQHMGASQLVQEKRPAAERRVQARLPWAEKRPAEGGCRRSGQGRSSSPRRGGCRRSGRGRRSGCRTSGDRCQIRLETGRARRAALGTGWAGKATGGAGRPSRASKSAAKFSML